MRFWTMLALLLALAATAVPASAQDRLFHVTRMEGEPFAGYEANIRLVFGEVYRADVLASVIVKPSFSPEIAIGLRAKGNGYELFALTPKEMIWTYSTIASMERGSQHVMNDKGVDITAREIATLKATVPARPQDLPLQRCAIALQAEPARAILAVWGKMLGEVRADDQPGFGNDGTSYIFSVPGAEAEVWEPEKSSRVGLFVTLTEAMYAYCRSGGDGRLRRVSELAASLAKP